MNLAIHVLAFGAVLSGILVITAKNPVISVVFLISVFINVAGYLILIGVAYIGILYIIVYVGAIAILFLFVIMMLNLRLVELLDTGKAYTQNLPLGTILGGLFFFELLAITTSNIRPYGRSLNSGSDSLDSTGGIEIIATLYKKVNNLALTFDSSALSLAAGTTDTTYNSVNIAFNPNVADLSFNNYLQSQSIGIGLYTYSTLWLFIASFILLLSIVGPIVLCINTNPN